MIGGNIPGETQVASISIYNYVEMLEYDKAYAVAITPTNLFYFISNNL